MRNSKFKWGAGVLGLATAAVLAIGAAGIGGPASAQEATEDKESRAERYQELLAGELGVTVEELTSARTTARDTLVDELLAAGEITAEQAERIKATDPGSGFRLHMRGHRIHHAVAGVFETAADIVGIPVEELRERIGGGENLVEIASGEGIDEATLTSELTSALTDKINQAVTDGEIDQERADMLLENLEEKVQNVINASGPFEGRGHRGPGHRFGDQN